MIGNAKVNSDSQNIYIGEKTYPATHGLVELLCKKRHHLFGLLHAKTNGRLQILKK